MHDIIELQIWQFLCVYLLLVIVLAIMKKYRIDKSKLLLAASIKITVQLVLAGYILTYMFENPRLSFTAVYVFAMVAFTIHRVLSKNKTLGKSFKVIVGASITISGLFTVLYFIFVVIGISAFYPQYIIPISGMVMGNTMTGVSLGLKTFRETLNDQHARIEALTCAGVEPERILHPFVKQALETAILPTLNSMLGMGIVSLPGMMTGQILSGTVPTTAILYQIAIMIAICTAVACSCFFALYFGSKTLIHKDTQMIVLSQTPTKR